MVRQKTIQRTPNSFRLTPSVMDIVRKYPKYGFESQSEMVEVAILLLQDVVDSNDESVDYLEVSYAKSDFMIRAQSHLNNEPSEAAEAMLRAMKEIL